MICRGPPRRGVGHVRIATIQCSILGPGNSRRRGGTAADGAGVRGRGEIDVLRMEFLKLDANMGLPSRQGRGPPRPPRPRLPSRPQRQPGPPPPCPRGGMVTGIVICSTPKQCSRRSVLPPLLSPTQNSSRRYQYEITKSTAKKDCCTSHSGFGITKSRNSIPM